MVCIVSLTSACTADKSHQPLNTEAYKELAIEPVRLVTIEEDGDVFFARMGGVSGDSKGNIFVTDLQQNVFHQFSLQGQHLGTYGSPGDGPGEFRYMSNMFVARDTLYIYDFQSARLTSYTSRSDNSMALHSTLEIDIREGRLPHGVLKSKDFYVVEGTESLDDGTQRGFLALLNRDGSMHEPNFIPLPWVEQAAISMGEQQFYVSVPFGRRSHYRLTPNDYFYYGWNDSVRIRQIDLNGNEVNMVRADIEYRPIASGEVDLDRYAPPLRSAIIDIIPSTKAAFDNFHVDGHGNILLNIGNIEEPDVDQWLIFTPESELIASFQMPRNITFFMVRDDVLYGRQRDEEGNQRIVVYQYSL